MVVAKDVRPIVTPQQMAEELGIRPSTLKSWAKDGLIPSIKPTRRTLRFNRERVLAALQGQSEEAAQ
jgi:excisionase family DNA binding protein